VARVHGKQHLGVLDRRAAGGDVRSEADPLVDVRALAGVATKELWMGVAGPDDGDNSLQAVQRLPALQDDGEIVAVFKLELVHTLKHRACRQRQLGRLRNDAATGHVVRRD
jgi:hypothetical protein